MRPPILLVEDNPMDVDLTQRALLRRKLTHPFPVARDGEEALDWIPKWDAGALCPAVILLDLNLPKVSGLDVLRILNVEPVEFDSSLSKTEHIQIYWGVFNLPCPGE